MSLGGIKATGETKSKWPYVDSLEFAYNFSLPIFFFAFSCLLYILYIKIYDILFGEKTFLRPSAHFTPSVVQPTSSYLARRPY